MEKKQIVYNFAIALPASILVLYFGLVFATRSLHNEYMPGDQDQPCIVDDHTRDCFINALHFLEMYDASFDESIDPECTRNFLLAYLKNHVKIAGRTDTLYRYLPTVIDYCNAVKSSPKKSRRSTWRGRYRRRNLSRKSAGTKIRPERAHKLWKRLQKKKVFRWPVHPRNFWVSSYYGPRTLKGRKGFHSGVDLAAPTGTRVSAAASGKVTEARYSPGYGNFIMITHANGYKTRYAHLSRIMVKVGQWVRSGQLIGKVGATGKVTKNRSSKSASHLHFEVYSDGKRVNPFRYLA